MSTPLPLSKACEAADLDRHELSRLAEDILPRAGGRHHRKIWEFALGVHALERADVLNEEAEGLSVAAGHEAVLFYLTNRCRRLFATDRYGDALWDVAEGSPAMLSDPDAFAPYPYRRRRLVVSYMDALDLRFEDGAFDFVISLGSIEHFGGIDAASRSLAEMARVVRPGGLLFITTEIVADGERGASIPNTEMFAPDTLRALVADRPELEWFGGEALDPDLDADDAPADILEAGALAKTGLDTEPHLRIATPWGRRCTSASLALRRRER